MDQIGLPFADPKKIALASYAIRKLQVPNNLPFLKSDFFASLASRHLPTPSEATDNLILWIADEADDRPGKEIQIPYTDPCVLGNVGVVDHFDLLWVIENLKNQGLFYLASRQNRRGDYQNGYLTGAGWQRVEQIRKATSSSNFAFFARKFYNNDLDSVFEFCLKPAIEQTGYELRTVTQRAGLIDAIIEDEIRRCRFLIVDLSDDNAGAYWEAGFAEGLGKPVIYICHADVETHFDTDHRQTVRWDLQSLDDTARTLKAVIRNTLLGDAKQSD